MTRSLHRRSVRKEGDEAVSMARRFRILQNQRAFCDRFVAKWCAIRKVVRFLAQGCYPIRGGPLHIGYAPIPYQGDWPRIDYMLRLVEVFHGRGRRFFGRRPNCRAASHSGVKSPGGSVLM